jgi:hypothetical protein
MGGAGIEPASPLGRRAPNWATRRRGRAARVSVQPPGRELDAHASRSGRALVTHWIAGAVANDVVYAARLPFDPGSPAWGAMSYAEGCWSPALTECHPKKLQAKVTRTYTCESGDTSWRTFLSQAGPQVGLELFKLSITFWLEVVDLPFRNEKGDPLGRPYLPWCLR